MTRKLSTEKVWVYISSTPEEPQQTENNINDRTYITDDGLLLKEKSMYLFDRTELTNLIGNILDKIKTDRNIELQGLIEAILE